MTLPGHIAWTALVAFVASLLTLLAIDHLAPGTSPRPAEDARVISPETLARHDHHDDCWMAIHGRVYDFTDYIPLHPTPVDVLTPYCGTDASIGWDTKGYGRAHSPRAHEMLPDYEIGVLAGSD